MNSPSSRIRLRDIARKISVSHSTVSRALKMNDPQISETVRERVQAKARGMDYSLNPMPNTLSHYSLGKRESLSGSVVAWINNWPRPEQLHTFREIDGYWRGAHACAEKFGYRLEEFIFDQKSPGRRMADILKTRGIGGILIPPHPCFPVGPDWSGFDWNDFSVVRLGRSNRDPAVHLAASDQSANAMLAVEKIRGLGYRRIGFVTGAGAAERGTLFQAGFLMAQTSLPTNLRLPCLIVDEQAPDRGQAQIVAWVRKIRPDAIFTDIAAMISLLEAAEIRVPEEIGVATTSVLDGNADAGIFQNAEEIGRVAFLVLLSRLQNHDMGIPRIHRQTLVAGEWVDGKSLPPRVA